MIKNAMRSAGQSAWVVARVVALAATFSSVATWASASLLYVGGFGGKIDVYDSATGVPINLNLVNDPGYSIEDFELSGSTLFLTNYSTVRTYNATTGALLNPSLITGLSAAGIEAVGNTIYVADQSGRRVMTYDATTGALINPNFIVAPDIPIGIEISGGDLYLGLLNGVVSKYDLVTGVLITNTVGGVGFPEGIAVSGNTLYVTTLDGVETFNATTGALINADLLTGFDPLFAWDIQIDGNNLYVADAGLGLVIQYNATTGVPIVFPSDIFPFIFAGQDVSSLAVSSAADSSVPEPATLALLGLALAGLAATRKRKLQ